MNKQTTINCSESYKELEQYFLDKKYSSLLLICGKSSQKLNITKALKDMADKSGIDLFIFDDFKPNPDYSSVKDGVALFLEKHCEAIVAIGGGSAMDVAKCIKLYCNMDHSKSYLEQKIVPNDIPLIVIPTTAGTGSEATRYAVIYYNGEKQSVSDYSCIPETVFFDPTVLENLPEYHKKAAMMDALCHATESCWSVNATVESRDYAKQAISGIIENYSDYLHGDIIAAENMQRASYLAGKAINISQTTAGHAMSYKITTIYGYAHGHAVGICVSKLFQFMLEKDQGKTGLFDGIAYAYGCRTPDEALQVYNTILDRMGFERPYIDAKSMEILVNNVNPVRLKNNPMQLTKGDIREIYQRISTGE